MPTQHALEEAYADAESVDFLAEARGQHVTASRLLSALEACVARRGAILDVGCWLGFLLAEARYRGWDEVTGIEPSRFAASYARQRLGLHVIEGTLFDAPLPPAHFDSIVLADVLEHLPDPAAALQRVREALAEDGVLAVALPNAGSVVARIAGRRWWSVIPAHVHYFTPTSLRACLARSGFSVIAHGTAPKTFSVEYYAGRIGGYSPTLARLTRAAVRRARLAGRIWTPDFHDRMLVVARSTS